MAVTVYDSLGTARELGLPIRWFTDGQEVPMDLHSAASNPAASATAGHRS